MDTNQKELQRRIINQKAKEIVDFLTTVIPSTSDNEPLFSALVSAQMSLQKSVDLTAESSFRIYFVNFNYYHQKEFRDSEIALEFGKSVCFEFSVREFRNGKFWRIISFWSPIGGTKYFV